MMESLIDRIQPAPIHGGFAMADYWVWCGSVIQSEDGLYHMFASRWPKDLPFFNGYIFYSEIVRAVAKTPEGPYEFREVVLGDRGADFWDGRMAHNPAIRKIGDTYLLYYIGATFPGEKPSAAELSAGQPTAVKSCYNTIRIGLATSNSINGPWQRPDRPILEPRPGKWDDIVVTNPAPCILDNGRIYLYYRSNTPQGLRIGLAASEGIGRPYRRLADDPVISFAGSGHVEDPFVWWQQDHFAMIAKDITGEITGEKHAGIAAVSPDGLNWHLADPPKAYSRQIIWDDGTRTIQGSLERPQLLFRNSVPTHLFAATADGPGGFNLATRTWNLVIPLKS